MEVYSYAEHGKLTGIYAIRNTKDSKVYIGSAAQSFSKRLNVHKHNLRKDKHHSPRLQRAWNRDTEDSFEYLIVEVVPMCEIIDDAYLTDLEQLWLDAYKPAYNVCPVAGSSKGRKFSPETIEKLKQNCAQRGESHPGYGKARPEEVRKKVSDGLKAYFAAGGRNANTGVPMSAEQKKKISEAKKQLYKDRPELRLAISKAKQGKPGYKHSQESIELLRAAKSKTWVVTDPAGNESAITNLNAFCREHGLSGGTMSQVASGKWSHHKGWKCKKVS